jgi:hypothetical protein
MTASRHGSRGRASVSLRAALVLTCMLLSQAQLQAAGRAQAALQEDRPIPKEKLIKSLKDGGEDTSKRIVATKYVELIRKHGVRFMLTPADERDIRREGKYLGPADLNKIVDALRDSYRPATSMAGRIEQVKVAPNPGGGIQVFVQLTVTNYGPPTVAQKYMLRIMHVTSARVNFNNAPVEMTEAFTVEPGSLGEVVIRPEDALTRKTRQAIRSGASVTGWLKFYLPPLPQVEPAEQPKPESLREAGVWYVVSFSDVKGDFYEDVFKVN